MVVNNPIRALKVTLAGLVSGPISVFAYALLSLLHYGSWPSYAHPDPKELELPLLHSTVGLVLMASILAFACQAVLVTYTIAVLRSRHWSFLGLLVAAEVAYIVWLLLDPGGVLNWYMD